MIRVLPPQVSERIAAGEVIERPASVVKELVENSVDAGATEIAVILQDGGKALIDIIDNGQGMTAADLALCVKRHATSKLQSLEDLERLRTLGFRGEALPSVAAVSSLSIVSRALSGEPGEPEQGEPGHGYKDAHELAPGSEAPRTVTFGHFLNSPHGTRVRAEGLFAQFPARLKFLKSASAEVSHVRDWMERLALAHPSIAFRLVSEDRTLMNLRPADTPERVRQVLSDGDDYPLVTAESEAGSRFRVRAYWLQGLSSPQARRIAQVVNGRSVRDRLLQQAILSAFRQVLLPGQFPALALFIDIDPAAVDVNVHPTKTELRFLESSAVFRAVQSLIEAMVVKHGAPAFAGDSSAPTLLGGFAKPSSAPVDTGDFWRAAEALAGQDPSSIRDDSVPATARTSDHPERENLLPSNAYVGTLFNTYLLFDLGEELRLVDQHAAHERIRYEELRRQVESSAGPAPSQALLIPEAVHFKPEERPKLETRLSMLEFLGFEAEVFGESSVLFRAVPAAWGSEHPRSRLKSLIERLLALPAAEGTPEASAPNNPSGLLMDDALFETLASEACHSAVRAGDRLEKPEAQALVNRLFSCAHPWNCPHGRPTLVRVPRTRFEEWFLRRV